ncbi:MAG: GNAT family N-acetyltransferase [Flavobacteriales bacterium]|nr:GNAT family N-acetyltransferase [Flavobacteriales bacterium]
MLKLNLSPFETIETKRTKLIRPQKEHAEDIFSMRKNIDAMKYIGKPLSTSIFEIRDLIRSMEEGFENNSQMPWCILLKDESKVIGTIGFHNILPMHHRSEIGYMLHPDYWNRGLMSEVIVPVIKFGFERMKLHSIEAKIDPQNQFSRKILLNNGFVKEAYFKQNYFFENSFIDTEIYSLLTPLS